MTLFRIFCAAIIAAVSIYTTIVIANHGMGLYPIFFGDIADMTWRGQFNVDFLCFLLMWRLGCMAARIFAERSFTRLCGLQSWRAVFGRLSVDRRIPKQRR